MHLLDTNVVSELRKASVGRADPAVVRWAESISASDMFLSAITLYEIEVGIGGIERRDPRQGRLLRVWAERLVSVAFEGRILPVDAAVAARAAALQIPDPRPLADALIAATAIVHGLIVVTRNGRDFAATGVSVLDPWTSTLPTP